MNGQVILYLYLVDDTVILKNQINSLTVPQFIAAKQYLPFNSSQNYVSHLIGVKVYIKPDSVAVLATNQVDEEELVNIYNRLIFVPAQQGKKYNRIIRKNKPMYPVFTEVGTDLLARENANEHTLKMVFPDDEVEERTTVSGTAAFREMNKLKAEYAKKNR